MVRQPVRGRACQRDGAGRRARTLLLHALRRRPRHGGRALRPAAPPATAAGWCAAAAAGRGRRVDSVARQQCLLVGDVDACGAPRRV
jgi:hypothetical protein